MKYREIAEQSTIIDNTHESLFRVYHILEEAKKLLEMGASNEVVLHIINNLESFDGIEDGLGGER